MSPVSILFFIFLLVPVVEIYLLIEVGTIIGTLPTVALVVFTALLGAALLRFQGLSMLQRTRGVLAQGRLPAREMLEGVLMAFAGALLLTPGFFTDAVGFALLVPPLRRAFIQRFFRNAAFASRQFGDFQQPRRSDHFTIEGEYHRDDD